MNKFIVFTKILLKTNGEFLSKKKAKSNRGKTYFLVLLIALSFLPIAISFGIFIYKSVDVLQSIGQEGIILSLGFAIASMIIFFFGIFYVMGTFYFSMDIENLLPLPLRPSHILGGKFTVVVLYEYLTELVVVLPIIIAYGIKGNLGFMYYLYSLIIFLTLPIVPLVIGSVLVMVIMRFTSFAKNKDRFKVIGGMIAIFFAVGVNFSIQKFIGDTVDPEKLKELLLSGNNSLISLSSKIFPTVKFAALGIVNFINLKGLSNILIYLLITIISLVVFMILGEVLYFKGVIGISETTSKRKKLNNQELNKMTVKNSSMKTYILKEIKTLLRTPAYFINCILVNFLWPIFILIPMYLDSEFGDLINSLSDRLNSQESAGLVIVIGFGVMLFLSSSNAVTATAISREGNNLYVNKYLPISYSTQIKAKIITGASISFISLVLILGVLIYLSRPSVLIIVSLLIVSIIAIVFSSIIGIFIDLNNPKLIWDNEQKAVKQNLNVLYSMLINIVFAGITIFIVFKFDLDLIKTLSVILGVFGVLDILMWKVIINKGAKIYSEIEI